MLNGLLSGPQVELVDVRENTIVFRSSRKLPEGRSVSVRVNTGQGPSISVKVDLQNVRPLGMGGFACTGQVGNQVSFQGFESSRMAGGDPFLRQTPRIDCRLRVLSPDLPGFRAVSVDFSTGGLQVEAEGSVEVGREIRIRIDFDGVEMPALDCEARVAWCQEQGRGALVGLQFIHLTRDNLNLLVSYENFLNARGDETIYRRVVGAHSMPNHVISQPSAPNLAPTTCGQIVGYSAVSGQATVEFQPTQGPKLRMQFVDYTSLVDHSRAAGTHISSLRDLPGVETTRYQFLGPNHQIVLEVEARDCSLS